MLHTYICLPERGFVFVLYINMTFSIITTQMKCFLFKSSIQGTWAFPHTVVDYNCMLAQTQLLLAQHDAVKVQPSQKYFTSLTAPPKILLHSIQPLMFNNSNTEYSLQETHLGLIRTRDRKATEAIKDRSQLSRRLHIPWQGLHCIGSMTSHLMKPSSFSASTWTWQSSRALKHWS